MKSASMPEYIQDKWHARYRLTRSPICMKLSRMLSVSCRPSNFFFWKMYELTNREQSRSGCGGGRRQPQVPRRLAFSSSLEQRQERRAPYLQDGEPLLLFKKHTQLGTYLASSQTGNRPKSRSAMWVGGHLPLQTSKSFLQVMPTWSKECGFAYCCCRIAR